MPRLAAALEAVYTGQAAVRSSPCAPGSRHCVSLTTNTCIPVAHDRRAASLKAGTLRHALHVVRHRARQRRRLRGADSPRISGHSPALPRHYAGFCRGSHDRGVLLVAARPRCVASAIWCPCSTLTHLRCAARGCPLGLCQRSRWQNRTGTAKRSSRRLICQTESAKRSPMHGSQLRSDLLREVCSLS